MNKINSVDELPKWFKLDNYRCFETSENKVLRFQLEIRKGIEYFASSGDTPCKISCEYDIAWKRITSRKPLLFDGEYCFKTDGDDERHRIKGTDSIMGTTLADVIYIADGLYKNSHVKKDDDYTYYRHGLLGADTNLGSRFFDVFHVHDAVNITIDLGEHTDDEIISDVRNMLPKWREQLSIESPDITYEKPSHLSKVLKYQILPYLDLHIWALLETCEIPARVYAAALFPKGNRGEVEFRQTVKPFFDQIINENYRLLRE